MCDQYDTDSAIAMLDAFASVGAVAFDVTLLDVDGNQRGFKSGCTANELCRSMERSLSNAIAAQHSIVVRPRSRTTLFVQLDDLTTERAAELECYAFLTLRTSLGNFQVWLAVSDGPKESDKEAARQFRSRVRRAVGAADGNASGATRIAGSLNFKKKYSPNFPRVEIVSQASGRVMTIGGLSEAGLIAPAAVTERPPAPVGSPSPQRASRPRGWPDYQQALRGAPLKLNARPDRSTADFFWCFLAIKWGWTVSEVAGKLLQVSEKAREQARKGDKRYAILTAQKAAAAQQEKKMVPPPARKGAPRSEMTRRCTVQY